MACLILAASQQRIATATPTAAVSTTRSARHHDRQQRRRATENKVGGPFRKFTKIIEESKRHLASAGIARSISIFAMYPIDTIKTRMQMEQSLPFRWQGIYKGVAGSLFGQVPYGILTFGSYEMYKSALLERFPESKPIFLYAAAAIMGDLTGSGWLCPSEVIKQQMQVSGFTSSYQKHSVFSLSLQNAKGTNTNTNTMSSSLLSQAGMYGSVREAATGIWKKKGLVGLYEGYFGGVTRDVPFRVSQLCAYEVTKNFYLQMKRKTRKSGKKNDPSRQVQLSVTEAAMCGAVSGSFSAAVTSPLDRIKTLLMTDSGAYGGTVLSCARQILQTEGPRGFLQGMAPRVIYIAPSVVIFFVVYEQAQQRLQEVWP